MKQLRFLVPAILILAFSCNSKKGIKINHKDPCSFVNSFLSQNEQHNFEDLIDECFVNGQNLDELSIKMYENRANELKKLKLTSLDECSFSKKNQEIVVTIKRKNDGQEILFRLMEDNNEFKFDGFVPVKKGDNFIFWM